MAIAFFQSFSIFWHSAQEILPTAWTLVPKCSLSTSLLGLLLALPLPRSAYVLTPTLSQIPVVVLTHRAGYAHQLPP